MFEETLQQLMGILGEGCSLLRARQLLFEAGGDLQHALNLYCDHPSAGKHTATRTTLGCTCTISCSWLDVTLTKL